MSWPLNWIWPEVTGMKRRDEPWRASTSRTRSPPPARGSRRPGARSSPRRPRAPVRLLLSTSDTAAHREVLDDVPRPRGGRSPCELRREVEVDRGHTGAPVWRQPARPRSSPGRRPGRRAGRTPRRGPAGCPTGFSGGGAMQALVVHVRAAGGERALLDPRMQRRRVALDRAQSPGRGRCTRGSTAAAPGCRGGAAR